MIRTLALPPDTQTPLWAWARTAREAGKAGIFLGRLAQAIPTLTLPLDPSPSPHDTTMDGLVVIPTGIHGAELWAFSDGSAFLSHQNTAYPHPIAVPPLGLRSPNVLRLVGRKAAQIAQPWTGKIATTTAGLVQGHHAVFWAPIDARTRKALPATITRLSATLTALLSPVVRDLSSLPPHERVLSVQVWGAHLQDCTDFVPPRLDIKDVSLRYPYNRALSDYALHAWLSTLGAALWADSPPAAQVALVSQEWSDGDLYHRNGTLRMQPTAIPLFCASLSQPASAHAQLAARQWADRFRIPPPPQP